MEIEKIIEGLELQKTRILNSLSEIRHADYYTILARRAYRKIEDSATKDSRIANLKGKNKNLFNKIKIRDHFEHDAETKSKLSNKELSDFGIVSSDSPLNINIRTSISILSGDITWNLTEDHQAFIKILEEFAKLLATKS